MNAALCPSPRSCRTLFPLTAMALLFASPAALAQNPVVTAGANHDIDFNEVVDISYNRFAGQWSVNFDLNHDPTAGPMIKRLESPVNDTGMPILLDAQQPFPQRIDEEIYLVPSVIAIPPGWNNVGDWHEEILTPGFVWVLPDDASFPGLFPDGTSLITKNGDPHPWDFLPAPALPNRLDVGFPALQQGDTLDIHKAVLWIGTDGNRIWGDNELDDGTAFDESVIRVWEYPTVPEPGSLALLALASGAALRRRVRRR